MKQQKRTETRLHRPRTLYCKANRTLRKRRDERLRHVLVCRLRCGGATVGGRWVPLRQAAQHHARFCSRHQLAQDVAVYLNKLTLHLGLTAHQAAT